MSAIGGLGVAWMRLVRFGFHLLYNEAAFSYDLVSRLVSVGQWRCWGQTSIRHLPPPIEGTVLELAYGTGNLHLELASSGYDLVGCDLSENMARITRQKFKKAGMQPRAIRGSSFTLPFTSSGFAAVVCTFPAPFIVDPASVNELYRVLTPGGRLVIVINAILTGESLLVESLEWLYRVTGQRSVDEHSDLVPPPVFERAGFSVATTTEDCRNSYAQLLIATKPV